MILKVQKYKDLQEKISKVKAKLAEINREIMQISEQEEIAKKWKGQASAEGELKMLLIASENLLKEILEEADSFIAQYSGMVIGINNRASEEHKENISEFHMAFLKAVEKEREINTRTSDVLGASKELAVIRFLKEQGVFTGYDSITHSTKMADIKRKLVNPFSESGI